MLNTTGSTNFRAFADTPDVHMFLSLQSHQTVFRHLLDNILRGSGVQVVTGEPGCGKTLIGRKLYYCLKSHERRFRVRLLPYPQVDTDLLTTWLDECLASSPVLLIDEAQALSREALIRLFKLLPTHPHLQLILLAQPEFLDALSHPDIAKLQILQSTTYSLDALDRQDTELYIYHRLRQAGYDPGTLICSRVIDTIFRLSHGTPRLINTVMRKSLNQMNQDQTGRLSVELLASVAQTIEIMTRPQTR